ncbi:MAG: T9SS type A sorting domain-containing protein, partial [Bacteroidia bacterium]
SVISVLVNPLPTITVNSGTICSGSSIALSANGASTYTWSPGIGLSSTAGASVAASPSITTVYTITGTGINGCTNTITTTVTVISNLTLVVNSATVCFGNSVTLTVSGANTYSWGPGAGLSATTGATVVASPTTTTVYTVTGIVGNCFSSQTTTVMVNPLPTVTIAAIGSATFCQGGSVTLTTTSGAGYLWSDNSTTQSITVNSTGNYSVTVTDGNGCSATSSVISVLVKPLPTATIGVNGSTTLCQGDNVILTASQGTSYLWSNSATTQSIMVSSSGNYTVMVTGANGCSATSSITSVVVNIIPTPSIAVGGSTMFCQGSSATLTASGGTGYLWSTGAITPSIIVNTAGDYSVTVTNGAGCSAISEVVTISVNPSPFVNLGTDTTTCGCILLNAYNPGASYNWSSGQNYSMINVCTSGLYWVNVSNGICITTDTIKVIVNPKPVVNIAVLTGSVVVLNAGNNGSTYLWNTGATTQTIAPTTSGVFYVTVTNQYGCSGSDTTSISVAGIEGNIFNPGYLDIYPNPTYDKTFTLAFDVVQRNTIEIRIVSALGVILYNERLENFSGVYNKKLGSENMAKGIYFVEVKSRTSKIVRKIAVE